MGNEWIIHVLADLQTFAEENELPLLAARLGETRLVANAEMGAHYRDAPIEVCGETVKSRPFFAQAGAGRSA